MKKHLVCARLSKTQRILTNWRIKLENNMWVEDKADSLERAFHKGDPHDMYEQIGSLMRFAQSGAASEKVCRVHDKDGRPAQSFVEEKMIFREHFTKTMNAKSMMYSDIIDKARQDSNKEGK